MKVLLLNASPKKTGATQEILRTVEEALPKATCGELVCLGDYQVQYCLGCKTCYQSGCCVHQDDMPVLLDKMDEADVLVIAAPSYWADVPGQLKVFIDRCTPFGDTNPDPHRHTLKPEKRCYAIALRTGVRPGECQHIIDTIDHWCGHMGVEMAGSLYFCQIEGKEDIDRHKPAIREKTAEWFGGD
ncbi:flavodoxin family protein [Acutalibacter sp. 1XD8-33]|uniref:flavodoxin family protein n=1 Tax=Acutalibacter sp. 1XD8-33 TaxID=2320081 RepID=UPI001313FA64|nr:flavodoxin family protein [Acutalibacter sp. 1XD8-33]